MPWLAGDAGSQATSATKIGNMKLAAAAVLLLALASVASVWSLSLNWELMCTGANHAEDECPEHHKCVALGEKVCKQVQDCTTDKYGKETCTGKQMCWEHACVGIPRYCEVVNAGEDECVTNYGKDLECKELKKPECMNEKECEYADTDKCKEYDNVKKGCKVYEQEEVCKDAEVCWTGKCVEVPKKGGYNAGK
ncbi:unnamed protein product [Ostreobium quekettii]|uniref:Uncharacterized protein n=1 Tax=Ostreobium quekettii TaxID=121088 RepID=A0A8S1J330_9CHLO|nr:unnamed protein product [Ostreobium quekettii]